jgi:hypothetical protein
VQLLSLPSSTSPTGDDTPVQSGVGTLVDDALLYGPSIYSRHYAPADRKDYEWYWRYTYPKPVTRTLQVHPQARRSAYKEWSFPGFAPCVPKEFLPSYRARGRAYLWGEGLQAIKLYVATSTLTEAGAGLFTAQDLKASSSPILYYSGEILSDAEARLRYDLSPNQGFHERDTRYLAQLNGVLIDASDPYHSGFARFINHQPSKLANCKINQYGGIVLIKDVPAYTELTYTYSGRWTKFFAMGGHGDGTDANDDAMALDEASSSGHRL